MGTVFFTGFPGFLGRELLPRVLERSDHRAVCLVQERYLSHATEARGALERAHGLKGRIDLVVGDITRPDLALGEALPSIARDVVEVFHLAAVYDLAVGRDFAMRVNVDGTRHILDFCEKCPTLRRHQYVSTCYVSGRYDGRFQEDDLQKGQVFNNFYEETKHLAEVEVRQRMDRIPTTIYRPSVVVGDSATGATQKYDGPYFAIRYMVRQPTPVVVMPLVGTPDRHRMNVVPRDFVVDAIAHLSGLVKSTGRAYALADPDPLTIAELIDGMERETRKRLIRVPLPLNLAKTAIDRVPGVKRFFGFPSDAVDYFVHPTDYDTTNTQSHLDGTGIAAPRFDSYLANLVRYVRANPEVPSSAMV
ncbi:MAG: SDR family oxidoreductase [Myxococcota bacterium]